MVLLNRADQPPNTRVFDGKREVNIFLFYIEYFAMRKKKYSEKHIKLHAHLHGEERKVYSERFTDNNAFREEDREF